MQETKETQVQSMAQGDPLERKMATHYSIPAMEFPSMETPMDRDASGVTVHGIARVRHNLEEKTNQPIM